MNPADLWETTEPTDDGPWPIVEAREHQLFSDVIEVLRPKILVEFGSWEGASALAWSREAREREIDTKIICIDTWLGSPEHWRNALPNTEWSQDHLRLSQGEPTLINTFRHAVLAHGFGSSIAPLRATSECGSEYLRAQGIQVDVVYIDANHDYRAVAQDLRFARSILNPHGIIAGDDWAHPPIKRAVLEFALREHQDVLVAPGRVNFVLISRRRPGTLAQQFFERGYERESVSALGLSVAQSQTRSLARRILKGSKRS